MQTAMAGQARLSQGMTRARSGLDSGDFHHQIGQPLGGIEPADGAGGGGHRGQPRGLGGERGNFRGQPVRREFRLRDPERAVACASTPALANWS